MCIRDRADSVHEVREDLGVGAAPELPIKAYENLNGDSIMHRFGEMDDPDEIRTVIAFEESHKNRKGVLKAAEARIEDIAKELAGSGATLPDARCPVDGRPAGRSAGGRVAPVSYTHLT